jgi:hypothetical protein
MGRSYVVKKKSWKRAALNLTPTTRPSLTIWPLPSGHHHAPHFHETYAAAYFLLLFHSFWKW